MLVRIALGSAIKLGLVQGRLDIAPTTLHIMTEGECAFNCGFCPQARNAEPKGHLARVTWPAFGLHEIAEKFFIFQEKNPQKRFKRICIQVVNNENSDKSIAAILNYFAGETFPISVCQRKLDLDYLEQLFSKGVAKVGLALDLVNEEAFKKYKDLRGKSFWLTFLRQAGEKFPGRITSHIIVGVDDSEQEIIENMKLLRRWHIEVGLFAFTPVKGTLLEDKKKPSLAKYRRIQLAHFFIFDSASPFLKISPTFLYDKSGRVIDFGLSAEEVKKIILENDVFTTTGCRNCNRPFYNERPGQVPFNYARVLKKEEKKQAWEALEL